MTLPCVCVCVCVSVCSAVICFAAGLLFLLSLVEASEDVSLWFLYESDSDSFMIPMWNPAKLGMT